MPEDLTREDEEESPKSWLKIGGCAALAIWSCNFIAGLVFAFRGDAQPLASFADSFAIVNALFSSVAVVGAVYAVILQQRELSLTRDEMRQARIAHQESADTQDRMTSIQGYSTMLADLSKEIEYLRNGRDAIRELNLEVAAFIREHESSIKRMNLLNSYSERFLPYFREAELLGLWSQKKYKVASASNEIPADILMLQKFLDTKLNAIARELLDTETLKTRTAESLRSAMVNPKRTPVPGNLNS